MEQPPERETGEPQAWLALARMIMGAWVPQAIYTAVSLGIFEHLHAGPRSGPEIATELGVPLATTRRLLRALVSLELCTAPEPDVVALTPRGRLLCTETPGSMRSQALFRGQARVWSAWGRLLDVVRTGKPVPELVAGKSLYEWLAEDPDGSTVFNQAMTEMSIIQAEMIADACDFSDAKTIVDVGGGYGGLVTAMLARYKGVRGVVFDRGECRKGSERLLARSGLSDRCRFVDGDFFEAVPRGGDVYLLKNVIHNWDDDRSLTILRACHTAMSRNARLLLIEPAVPARISASLADTVAVGFDLQMLLLTTGCERTERQYRSLLEAAGFEETRLVPTSSALNLIEACRMA